MYDPEDSNFDEEEFIKSNLNFLIESDDDYYENSENNSSQLHSYEENSTIYGTSSIYSRVNETWSSLSSGSIVSPKETPSRSSTYYNTNLPISWNNSRFSVEDWYSHLSIEDIFFGQNVTPNTRDLPRRYNPYLDPNLYKLWNNTCANKPQGFPRDNFNAGGQFFCGPAPINTKTQYNDSYYAYSNSVYKMWPYSNCNAFQCGSRAKEVPLNYFNPWINAGGVPHEQHLCGYNVSGPRMQGPSQSYGPCNKCYKLCSNQHLCTTLPTSYTSHHICGAEEALDNYFRKNSPNRDLNTPKSDNSFKNLSISRTSTPISRTVENKVTEEKTESPITVQEATVTGALPKRSNASTRNDTERKSCPEPITFEDFMRTEPNAVPAITQSMQNNRSNKFEFCKFCYKNGELSDVYMSHITKLSDGKIICPILRKYVCDLCGATGDKAHTRKYCALNPDQNRKLPFFRRLTNGVMTSSYNHK